MVGQADVPPSGEGPALVASGKGAGCLNSDASLKPAAAAVVGLGHAPKKASRQHIGGPVEAAERRHHGRPFMTVATSLTSG